MDVVISRRTSLMLAAGVTGLSQAREA